MRQTLLSTVLLSFYGQFQSEPQGCALGYCPHRYAQGARWFERVDSYRWISLSKSLYSRRRLLNELVKFTPALLAISRPNMGFFSIMKL